MNRTRVCNTVLLLAAAASLAACGDDPDLESVDARGYVPAAVEAEPDPDGFRTQMIADGLVPMYGTSGVALELGYTICAALEQGQPISGVRASGVAADINERDIDILIGHSVNYLCPEHDDQLEG